MARPKAELVLSADEQAQLSTIARSRAMPAALSQRARIVPACAAGDANSVVARRFELHERHSEQVASALREAAHRSDSTTSSGRDVRGRSRMNRWRG